MLTLTGPITGGSAGDGLVVNGPGTVQVTSANTFPGGTLVTGGGTLAEGPLPLLSTGYALGTGPVTLAGGTLQLNPSPGRGTYQTFPNPITVTADSTINNLVNYNQTVLLGGLTIGTNTLYVTGPAAGSTMYIGPATLTGTATFNVAANQEIQLFPPTGGGGVVKTNAGVVDISTTATLSSLSVQAGFFDFGEPGQVLTTGSLTFAGTTNAWVGTLLLFDGDVIVHNGSLAAVTNQVRQGFNGGVTVTNGNYTGGIYQGYFSNGFYPVIGTALAGALGITTFDGQSVVATDVLLKSTVFGDANLDGVVDGLDYARIDAGFLGQSTASPLTGWANGDFKLRRQDRRQRLHVDRQRLQHPAAGVGQCGRRRGDGRGRSRCRRARAGRRRGRCRRRLGAARRPATFSDPSAAVRSLDTPARRE